MNRRIKKKQAKRLPGCSYSETRKMWHSMKPIIRKNIEYCNDVFMREMLFTTLIWEDMMRPFKPTILEEACHFCDVEYYIENPYQQKSFKHEFTLTRVLSEDEVREMSYHDILYV